MQKIVHFCFFLLALSLAAQEPIYMQYGIENGLPTTETFDIHQDQDGFIWIATNRGLSKYDGYEFKTFTSRNGLKNTEVHAIFEVDNNILASTIEGLNKIENDSITPLGDFRTYGVRYANMISDSVLEFFWNHRECKNQRAHYNIKSDTLINIQNDNKYLDTLIFPEAKFIYVDSIERTPIDGELTRTCKHCYQLKNGKRAYLLAHHRFNNKDVVKRLYKYFEAKNGERIFIYEPEKAIPSSPKEGYIIEKDGSIKLTWPDILRIVEFRNDLWICTRNGILIYKDGNLSKSPIKILENVAISDIIQDKEGNYWIASLNKGVLKIPNIEISNKTIGVSKDFIIVKELVIENTQLYLKDHNNKYLKIDSVKDDDLSFSYINHNEIYDLIYYNSDDLDVRQYANTDSAERWQGTKFGLVQYDQKKPLSPSKKLSEKFELLGSYIYHLSWDKKNTLWLSTVGEGLLYYNTDTVYQTSTKDGLSNNTIYRHWKENDSTMWAGSNRGLNKINYFIDENDKPIVKDIEVFTAESGLPSNEVLDFKYWNGLYWIATGNGLCVVEPDKLTNKKIKPKLFIDDVQVNQNSMDSKNLELEYEENNIKIGFTGVSFNKPVKKDFYTYRLITDEIANNWETTNERELTFLNLAPGEYEFQLYATEKNGTRSNIKSVFFNISPHFSNTLWFELSLALLIIVILVLASLHILRLERRKQNLIQAKLTGLQSQMNPHFIFNTLNSIQFYILQNDIKNASNYLSNFAKLIRKVLDFSFNETISLEDEINQMKQYLELEKLRFENKFEFEFEVDKGVDTENIYIPPMLIQPNLENAIIHGLLPKEKDAWLRIKISNHPDKEETILINIIDNGIGRESASQKKRINNSHKSYGLSILKEKVKLINQKRGKKHRVEFYFKDRKNTEGLSTGTEVVLIIPHND